jgi:hypothetical protein
VASWSEKLNDPRWTAKAQEVKARSGYQCSVCTKTEGLEVHHGAYYQGLAPWEYPDESLWCLCGLHHEQAQRRLNELLYQISTVKPIDLPTPEELREFLNIPVLRIPLKPYEAGVLFLLRRLPPGTSASRDKLAQEAAGAQISNRTGKPR